MIKKVTLAVISTLLGNFCMAAETENDRWNLADLYVTQATWDADSKKLEQQFKDFSACNGKLATSVQRFKACLDLSDDMMKRYARLSTYATQSRDQDTGATLGQEACRGSHRTEAIRFSIGKRRVNTASVTTDDDPSSSTVACRT